jgi:hypothetical protein
MPKCAFHMEFKWVSTKLRKTLDRISKKMIFVIMIEARNCGVHVNSSIGKMKID